MIAGSYGILLTPFKENGRVDFKKLEQEVDALCQTNMDGIVTCGSTSEFLFCTAEENKEILKVVYTVSAGRKDIIGGASSPGRQMTTEYLEFMGKVGIKTALVSPPYYYKYTDAEIGAFYKEIAGAGVNVIAYHVPGFTNSINEPVFLELLRQPQIIGMKNSGQNIREISNQAQIRDSLRKDFSLLTGTEEAILPCLAAGCNGAFTAFGTLMPDYIKDIFVTFEAKQYEVCKKLQSALLPLTRLCASLTFPIGYKLFGELVNCCTSSVPQSTGEGFEARAEELKAQLQAAYNKVMLCWKENKSEILNAKAFIADERGKKQ